jgi:hypothetical protein
LVSVQSHPKFNAIRTPVLTNYHSVIGGDDGGGQAGRDNARKGAQEGHAAETRLGGCGLDQTNKGIRGIMAVKKAHREEKPRAGCRFDQVLIRVAAGGLSKLPIGHGHITHSDIFFGTVGTQPLLYTALLAIGRSF